MSYMHEGCLSAWTEANGAPDNTQSIPIDFAPMGMLCPQCRQFIYGRFVAACARIEAPKAPYFIGAC